jgi:hypothetical protein
MRGRGRGERDQSISFHHFLMNKGQKKKCAFRQRVYPNAVFKSKILSRGIEKKSG